MEPRIVDKSKMTLVGVVGCAGDVAGLDVRSLWRRFEHHAHEIQHAVGDVTFELHVQESDAPIQHFCLIGLEVERLAPQPGELFAKVVPGGRYAVFTHRLGDGSFGVAFERIYAWLDGSPYRPAHPFDLQRYDERFLGPDDRDSVLEIHVPITSRIEVGEPSLVGTA